MLSGMSFGEPTQALQSRQFEQEADRAAEAVENNRKPDFSFSNLTFSDFEPEENATSEAEYSTNEPSIEGQELAKESVVEKDVSLMRKSLSGANKQPA
jgi:hypothetical protein